jgi:anti-sigma factor RsiW/ribosomal silencing factor RsfS
MNTAVQIDEIDEKISLYIDGKLDKTQSDEFEAHLAECPECKEKFEEVALTVELCGNIPEEEPPACLDALIMEKIRKEARRENEVPSNNILRFMASRYFRYISVGVAACLCIAVILTGILKLPHGKASQTQMASMADRVMSAAGNKAEAYVGGAANNTSKSEEQSNSLAASRPELASKSAADAVMNDNSADIAITVSVTKPQDELVYIKDVISKIAGKPMAEQNIDQSSYSGNKGDIIIKAQLSKEQYNAVRTAISEKYKSSMTVNEINGDTKASDLWMIIDIRSK